MKNTCNRKKPFDIKDTDLSLIELKNIPLSTCQEAAKHTLLKMKKPNEVFVVTLDRKIPRYLGRRKSTTDTKHLQFVLMCSLLHQFLSY